MRNSLRMMPYMLYALLIFALSGCGATGTTTGNGAQKTAAGKLTATVVMPKSAGKSVGLEGLPPGVTRVRIMVTGANIPTAKKDFAPADEKSLAVYPGTQLVATAYAYIGNDLAYEAIVPNVAVYAPVIDPETGLVTNATAVILPLKDAVKKDNDTPCMGCHEGTRDTDGQNLVVNYKQSGHYLNDSMTFPEVGGGAGTTLAGCSGCHGVSHQDLNPAASGRCATCHFIDAGKTAAGINSNHMGYTGGANNTCGQCHVSHFFKGKSGCLGCHSIGQNASGIDADNDGVRAVTQEFSKTSHHVTGRAVENSDCAACHLEGNANGSINTTYHNKDGKIYLRNGLGVDAFGTAPFVWDPVNPNHTTMDNFCMSCHNANGSPAAEALFAAVDGRPAINPFNSGLTNSYDTMKRPAVVAVYEQFDTGNTAHHAVRGKKYNARTRTAAFSNNSSAALPGVRMTIYDAGLFVKDYTPLGATLSVADNSTLHCGDCHTVGQFKPGSTTNDKGVATTVVIGAHGSNNEYMLRNASGADALHHQSNNASATAGPVDGTYVCFLCHAQTEEETGGYNAMGFHAGMEGANTSYCNGRAAESVGLTGFGGTFSTTYDANGVKVGQTRVPNIVGTNSNGNLFGYSCAHCHNAGQNNTFGGIHGGKDTYMSYSGSGTKTAFVQKKPYRFTGGLSLRYNGGGDDSTRWENNAKFDKSRREGCYNQSTAVMGTSDTSKVARLWGPNTRTDEFGTVDTIPANPDGANGTWGSCAHHSGVTTAGSGTQPIRAITRPLKY